ncbi:MAG: DUF309 domain-containing protein [Bdellovibrionota bacterium]
MSAQATLDEIWVKDETENKDFFGGLIQCAVSLYHLTNDNPNGAKKIYERARLMIDPYGENKDGINLAKLKQDMDKLYASLDEEFTDLDYMQRVPQLEFNENS